MTVHSSSRQSAATNSDGSGLLSAASGEMLLLAAAGRMFGTSTSIFRVRTVRMTGRTAVAASDKLNTRSPAINGTLDNGSATLAGSEAGQPLVLLAAGRSNSVELYHRYWYPSRPRCAPYLVNGEIANASRKDTAGTLAEIATTGVVSDSVSDQGPERRIARRPCGGMHKWSNSSQQHQHTATPKRSLREWWCVPAPARRPGWRQVPDQNLLNPAAPPVNVNASMTTSGVAVSVFVHRRGVKRASATLATAVASDVFAYRRGVKRTTAATATGTTTSSRRVGRKRASAATGAGVTQVVHRRGVSRSTLTSGQATTSSTRRRGVLRGTASACTATVVYLHRKGVKRSALSSGVGLASVAHRRGVKRALTAQGTNSTPFTVTVGTAAFNVNAVWATNGTGVTTSARRKGAKRPFVVQGTGSAPWSRRRGTARGSSCTGTGATPWTRRFGVARALGTVGRATVTFRTPAPHRFTTTGAATSTFTHLVTFRPRWEGPALWACPNCGDGMMHKAVGEHLGIGALGWSARVGPFKTVCDNCDFWMEQQLDTHRDPRASS